MATIILKRWPTWVIILITATLIFGALELADLLVDSADETELDELKNAPVILFLGIGIVVYILEAMLFTVIPIELSYKFTNFPWLGAVVGIILYGSIYHGSNGVFSVLITSWLILVFNSSYLILRQRSRKVAIVSTIGLKIIILFYAAFSIYSTIS